MDKTELIDKLTQYKSLLARHFDLDCLIVTLIIGIVSGFVGAVAGGGGLISVPFKQTT